MNTTIDTIKRVALLSASVATVAGVSLSGGIAHAAAADTNTASTTDQQHLQTIISKGDQEITRRLATLNTLDSKINAATKLNATDKSYLTAEVNGEITGLTTLKTKLDADTTLAAARADAQSIFNEYRVYALVAPKVSLVKVADDQQVVEGKLTALIQKLQTRINTAKSNGKDVTTLQNQLNDLTTQVNNAQSISSSIEQKVLTLQPSDYDSNHAILSGDSTQLKAAHSDNEAAYNDAKNIISELKNL